MASVVEKLKSAAVKLRLYIPWLYLTRYPFLYALSLLMFLSEYSENKKNREYQVSTAIIYVHLAIVITCTTFLIFQYKPRLFSLILAVEQPLANYFLFSVAAQPPEWQKLHYGGRIVLQFASFLLMSSGYANYPARRSIHPKVRHVAVCCHGMYLVSVTFLVFNEPTLRSALIHLFGEEHGDVCSTMLGLFIGAAAAFYLSGHPSKLLSTVTLALLIPYYIVSWNIPYWQRHHKTQYWYCIRNILDDSCFLSCLSFYMFMFR
ncbi:transmembrane protein 101-like [Symsagittifera roscoffensis]|uniref:transmembrane protein 101-like n=1 Tax=Symsagittifera roscoffensis TaxID=84072 RepID=UPI00307BC946